MRLILPFILVSLAPPAAAQSSFDGRYHWSLDRCGDAMTVTITGDRTNLYGTCILTEPTRIRGLQAMAFDLVCVNEDRMQTDERVILSFDPEGGLLVVRNAGYDNFVRCR
jgi:hypothetical protein